MNNLYSIYLESVFQLANTLVIKFDKTVESINEYTELLYPGSVNYQDPTTWKYYLNVSGEYHFRDTPMTITSLDTLEEIVFTKENLEDHRATRNAYAYGTRYYLELVANYPDQETLILGILYPVDIQKAINAKNGEIIGYPGHLIEPNEYSLMSRLQTWIYSYIFRWVNEGFNIAHDLYYLTWQSVLFSLLPQTILSLRHEMCKTNEAHSFHVWTYLASHGKLNKYKQNLTIKQALWLYRNILHIKTNLGQIDTFEFLTEHIMTARYIPLSGYDAEHNLRTLEQHIETSTVIDNPSEIHNLYPHIEFRRNTLNGIRSVEVMDPITLNQLLIKEDEIAKDNYNVRLTDEPMIQSKIENSLSNYIQTKALESTLFDYSGSSPYNLENIILNHWISLASKDIFKSFIVLENPRSGDIFTMSVKDAFVFSYYFFCKSFNLELTEVPIVPAIRVQRTPLVTVDDIMKVADKSLMDRSIAKQMLSLQPTINDIISVEAFNVLCNDIYKSAQHQINIVAYQEHYYRRGLAHGMISQIYCDEICHFDDPGKLYSDWFDERSIVISDYDFADPGELWYGILMSATGLVSDDINSLANIQKAMTNIMIQLSSYTVQFINEINTSPLRLIEPLVIRPGDTWGIMKLLIEIDHMAVRVKEHKGKLLQYLDYDIGACGINNNLNVKLKGWYDFEITVKPQTPLTTNRIVHFVDIGGLRARVLNVLGNNDRGIVPLPGMDIYLSQSEEDQKLVADMYDNCYINQQKH